MPVYRLNPGAARPLSRFDESASLPQGSVLVLGYFDGVHRGHAALINEARSAVSEKCTTAVWTPASVPKASAKRGLITTPAEKLGRFASLGADYAVIDDFAAIRRMQGREFFSSLIAERLKPSEVVCGENFRFGENASCGAAELAEFAASHGIACRVLPLMTEMGKPISSTVIRSLIAEGRISEANELLGFPYSVTSQVLHGKALGRTIGCPTINQRLPEEKITPKNGVYACTVTYAENGVYRELDGVCNIGSRPTVNSDTGDITLETFIIGFCGDLYGQTVTTSLCSRIRGEKAFASVNELSDQIREDAQAASAILKYFKEQKERHPERCSANSAV